MKPGKDGSSAERGLYVNRFSLRLTKGDLLKLAKVRAKFPLQTKNQAIQTCIAIAAKKIGSAQV
jgi:hypothetical protein